MKPIRPPAVAQRLVDAYMTGLRQRLPVLFIKQLDKLPQATEIQLQSLRKAFPQVPLELTHLLQRFNGSSWEVCVMSSNSTIICSTTATGSTYNNKESTTAPESTPNATTPDKLSDLSVSSSSSPSVATSAEEYDSNITPSAADQEETRANFSAKAAQVENETKNTIKSQDGQNFPKDEMQELQKSNDEFANNTNNAPSNAKNVNANSMNAGNITSSVAKESTSKKASKSPPAVAVAAAATAASFIKSTLVGKRSSSSSSSSPYSSTSTSSKHTRKERNAIPVLGSTFAACPYYLHSIEYMLSRQLPFAAHTTLPSPEQTQELEKQHEQQQKKEQEEQKKKTDTQIGNQIHDDTDNTSNISSTVNKSDAIQKEGSNAISQHTGKVTLASVYSGYTFLHEPPRAPWENTENTVNVTQNDHDVNVVEYNQNNTGMDQRRNNEFHKETSAPLTSEKIAENTSSAENNAVHVDKNVSNNNNNNEKQTKIRDSGAIQRRCVYIDNKIDPNSDLTLWLNFAQSLFPHHLPKLLTEEEVKQESHEQHKETQQKKESENVELTADLQKESQETADMTASTSSSLPVNNTLNDNGKGDNSKVANAISSKDKASSEINNGINTNISLGINAVNDRSAPLPLYRTTESHLFIDFHPSELNQGARGQVIQYIRHPESFTVIADDFGSYLKYLMSEEYDFIEELEDDYEDEINTLADTTKDNTTIIVKAEAQTICNPVKASKPEISADNASQTTPPQL